MDAWNWARGGALATLTTIAVGAGGAMAAAPDPVARCIADRARSLDLSGVVSIVSPNGTIVYARGVTGDPGGEAIGEDTRFNLGSAGKMFTAVAVAQLVESGKIGLDDPIGRRVEGLTPQTSAVTLRQLLSHTSGLGNFFTPENLPAIARARAVSDLMALAASDSPAFAPGSRFQYSNTGFLILGRLVERVSGLSYGDYLQRFVFAPAGMGATGLEREAGADTALGLTAMQPLQPGGEGPPAGPSQGPLRPAMEAALRGNPAGGAYSTTRDMQGFFAALTDGRLVGATILGRMLTPVADAATRSPPVQHGLGLGVGAFEGHRWFGHNGGAPGVNVEASDFPDDRASVVVMTNRDPPTASLMFREVRAMLFDPAAACPGVVR